MKTLCLVLTQLLMIYFYLTFKQYLTPIFMIFVAKLIWTVKSIILEEERSEAQYEAMK